MVPKPAVFDVELRAVAVLPRLCGDHLDLGGRRGPRKAPQLFFQDGALGGELIFVGSVLIVAAAAPTKVFAAGLDALWSAFQHLQRAGANQTRFFPFRGCADALARQAEWREYHAPVKARETVAAVNEFFDPYLEIPSTNALTPVLLTIKTRITFPPRVFHQCLTEMQTGPSYPCLQPKFNRFFAPPMLS
jgi:hypothetical protein